MELFWTPEATQDRDEIYDHIEADNPAAALALDELFAEKAGRLVDHPGFGRPGSVAGTRELVAHHNYILVYDVAGDLVRVLRVLHAARQWPPVISNTAAGHLNLPMAKARGFSRRLVDVL